MMASRGILRIGRTLGVGGRDFQSAFSRQLSAYCLGPTAYCLLSAGGARFPHDTALHIVA